MKKNGRGKRFLATSGVLVAIAISGLLGAGRQAVAGDAPEEGQARYAPGVLILKFKDPAAHERKRALIRGEPLHEVSVSPSPGVLRANYGLKKMRMLFRVYRVMESE
jgi:hypothetical protein